MAGGTGTRLWPMSRRTCPKQCLALTSAQTLVQMAAERISARVPPECILVITNPVQADLIREQLPQLPPENIIEEPCARGSATCIGLGALLVEHVDPEAPMIVLSADHVIQPTDRFLQCVDAARQAAAERERLVVFGIKPRGPSPEFGYIHRGQQADQIDGIKVYHVAGFKEKPAPAVAQQFLDSGEYYWNSGMFLWTVPAILKALKQHMPMLYSALVSLRPAIGTDRQHIALAQQYEPLKSNTIDYGVMEKADNVAVVEADFEWDDIGTWPAVAAYHLADASGNVVLGQAELLDAKNCIVRTEDGHLIGVVGVEGLVIVHTPDATLVCPRDRAGQVRELVEQMKRNGRTRWL
jgi:mannose-1-phosphate guanylyltransferase